MIGQEEAANVLVRGGRKKSLACYLIDLRDKLHSNLRAADGCGRTV